MRSKAYWGYDEEFMARDSGFEALLIEADPQAESFYLRMGAVRIGDTVSSATGRTLPLLRAAIA
jgi:hypothetical protein